MTQGRSGRNTSKKRTASRNRRIARAQKEIEKLIGEAEELGAMGNPQVRNLLKSVLVQPNNSTPREMLERVLSPYRTRSFTNPNPFRKNLPDSQNAFPGNMALADLEGLEFRMEPDDLVRHMLIVGQSGSGKTCLTLLIVSQLLGENN